MGQCKLCEKESAEVSGKVGYCADCIRAHYPKLEAGLKNVRIANQPLLS